MAPPYSWLLLSVLNVCFTHAGPISQRDTSTVVPPITNSTTLDFWIAKLKTDLNDAEGAYTIGQGIFSQIVPGPGPKTIPALLSQVNAVTTTPARDFSTSALYILLNGLAGGDFATIVKANTKLSSSNNTNKALASTVPKIYPKASSADAPYSVSEAKLRAAMYIPPDFTYGKLPPVLFLPGTACISGQSYGPNYGKLFKSNSVADPVYVNIPGNALDDIQINAEYIAYATNYIYSVTGKNVSTVSFSQGSVSGQWALKYWPSARSRTSNKISLSPDYHGTDLDVLVCPLFVPCATCTAGLLQQEYNSKFIATLRNHGGDSAYVPTTNIYSIFDEVVQPQTNGNASGSLHNAHGAGVSNIELQATCGPLLPGGTADYDHESILFNALGYALAVDAIKNGGPAQLSRVDTKLQCAQISSPGLSLADLLATEAVAPLAVAYGIEYFPKAVVEPPIMAYAQKDVPK